MSSDNFSAAPPAGPDNGLLPGGEPRTWLCITAIVRELQLRYDYEALGGRHEAEYTR
ncbi:MAG: hypothetical protein HY914_03485 [Desulfomonile tiedjei]|nr:hypothetical protein [Desulfomonile tiedjei]